MDEFDSMLDMADDVPLHLRVARKLGTGNDTNADSFTEITGRVSITPPPPYEPSDSEESTSERVKNILSSIDNVLDPKLKSKKTNIIGKRKNEESNNAEIKVPRKRGEATSGKSAKPSKEYKEAEKIFNKQTDKHEVNKYMLVCIDPQVVSCPAGSEILNFLSNPPTSKPEEVFQFRVENQNVPSTLTWKRKILYLNDIGGMPQFQERWIDEQRTLLFGSADEIAAKILDDTFQTWAQSIKSLYGEHHQLTLVVYNYNSYLKADRNAQERAKKAAVRGESANIRRNGNRVSDYQFQEALLSLSIESVMDYRTFDKDTSKGWKDLAGMVFHHTRAVAEAPEKLKKNISNSAGFEFYAKADVKDSISPKNLLEYWKQVLMQVTTMSLERANAIVLRYPSPSLLIEAYRNCSSRSEAELLLANIEIRRVDTIVGGTRRLGDEISRKIYCAFTTSDPLSLLNK